MTSLTVLYPTTADSRFDMAYYLTRHTPLVRQRLSPVGLTSLDLDEGLAGAAPDSPPAFVMVARMTFASPDDLQ